MKMGDQLFNCPVCCNESFGSKELLIEHLGNVLDSLYCSICNKKYESLVQLIEHLGQDDCVPVTKVHSIIIEQRENAENVTPVIQSSDSDRELQNELTTTNDNSHFAFEHSYEAQEPNGTSKMYVELFRKPMTSPTIQSGEIKEFKVVGHGENRYMIISHENTGLNAGNTIVTKQNNDGTISLTDIQVSDVKNEIENSTIIVSENEVSTTDNEGEAYSCNGCNMTFSSVIEHIQTYHNNQEVFLEGSAADAANAEETIEYEALETEHVSETQTSERTEQISRRVITDTGDIVEETSVVQGHTIKYESDEPVIDDTIELENEAQTNHKNSETQGDPKPRAKGTSPYHKVIAKEIITKKGQLPIKMYQCQVCEVMVSDINEFKVKECNTLRYACAQCPMAFDNSKSLCAHMRVHKVKPDNMVLDAVSYECSVCCTVFPSNKSLKLHKRMHDPIKARPIEPPVETIYGSVIHETRYRCNICDKLIPVDYREIHKKSHNTSDKMNCTICNKKFNSIEYLEMHMNVHNMDKVPVNNQDQSLPYHCLYCNRRFARPHEKVKHERIHTGEKPHSCEICGKSFRVSYCLTLHMRTHTGARPYACPHCGKRFKAHSVYNHHLMTHSEVRAYKCPFCPKAFKTSVQLAGHKNSHTKPFSCQHCNRPFASLYAVRVHTETHARPNNLKFSCELCGASYARAFALKDHIKQAHKLRTPASPASPTSPASPASPAQITDEDWIIKDVDTGIQDGIQSLNKELTQEINDLDMNASELIVP